MQRQKYLQQNKQNNCCKQILTALSPEWRDEVLKFCDRQTIRDQVRSSVQLGQALRHFEQFFTWAWLKSDNVFCHLCQILSNFQQFHFLHPPGWFHDMFFQSSIETSWEHSNIWTVIHVSARTVSACSNPRWRDAEIKILGTIKTSDKNQWF